MAIKELLVKISGDDSGLQKALDRTTKGLDEAGFSVDKTLGKFIGPAGLAVALGAVAKAAIDTAFDFEKANEIIAKTTGATGKELAALNKSFQEFNLAGSELSFEDSAAGISELNVRLGLVGSSLVKAAGAVADFADVTNTNMAESVRGVSVVMAKWGMTTSEMPGLLDKLYAASTSTGISVDKLTDQLTGAGAQLQAMGFGIDESIALLASFEKSGVNAGNVMSGMSQAVRKFAEEGVPATEGFSNLVKAIKDAKDPSAAYALGAEKMGRASVEFVSAVRSGKFELAELTEIIKKSEGAVAASASASDTWADKLAVLQNKAKAAAAELVGLNSEEAARQKVAASVRLEFVKALETEEDVYAAARKVTEQYGISVDELKKMMAESTGLLRNEGAVAEAAKLTNEEYKKQLEAKEKLRQSSIGTQYEYLAQVRQQELIEKEKARVEKERDATRKAAIAIEIKGYQEKAARIKAMIKDGLIPEQDGIKEIVKLHEGELDTLVQKGIKGDELSRAEKARITELQTLIRMSADDFAISEERKAQVAKTTTDGLVIGMEESSDAMAGLNKLVLNGGDSFGIFKNNAIPALELTADEAKRYGDALNLAEKSLQGLDRNGIDSLKKLGEQMKKEKEQADITAKAFEGIGKGLVDVAGKSTLDGLKKVGEALGKGEDAGKAAVTSLKELGRAILDALPNLFLQAGLQLMSVNVPLGVALLVASGSTAVLSGLAAGADAKDTKEIMRITQEAKDKEEAEKRKKEEQQSSVQNRLTSVGMLAKSGIISDVELRQEEKKIWEEEKQKWEERARTLAKEGAPQERLDTMKKLIDNADWNIKTLDGVLTKMAGPAEKTVTLADKLNAVQELYDKKIIDLGELGKNQIDLLDDYIDTKKEEAEALALIGTQGSSEKISLIAKQIAKAESLLLKLGTEEVLSSSDYQKTGNTGRSGFVAFANGTDWAPGGLSLVGERGPELVKLPQGAQVTPNHEMNRASGGNTFIFHSPKALDVGEAKRVFISEQRRVAFAGGL